MEKGSWISKNMLFLSLQEDKLLAITAYGEAGIEGGEGMMAVLNVIRNRTMFPEFYDSEIYELTRSPYHAVILKPYQFSVFNIGNPGREVVERIAKNFEYELIRNRNLQIAYNLSQILLSGALADNTGGATHYHANYVRPKWSEELAYITQIGRHLFYTSKPGETTTLVAGISPLSILILGGVFGLLLLKEG